MTQPTREQAFRAFVARNPGYESARLDGIRRTELARLDAEGHVYLDYTGGGLYGASQVRAHAELLLGSVLGNPHSSNPTSAASSELVERTRQHVLAFFGADPAIWDVVFTANASHALKLVGESYPFEVGDRFLLTFDNHNSVNGIREYDRAHGAHTTYVPLVLPDLRLDDVALEAELSRPRPGGHNLFAFPAQSNFSGVRHPLSWAGRARGAGWDVLLDAAAYVPTSRLNLGEVEADWVALSFYKMFGWPTGVGALIGRREALARLHRPWFSGGTITVASVQADRFSMAPGGTGFEDGTLDYASIPAVDIGLSFLEEAGLEAIGARVEALTGWLLDAMGTLRHEGGERLVVVYGPLTMNERGGTIAFNLVDPAGHVIDHRLVEERANGRRISLRTGCFCNPGAGEVALGLARDELTACFGAPGQALSWDDFRQCVDGKSTGAVRVSLGIGSTFDDAWALVDLLRTFAVA